MRRVLIVQPYGIGDMLFLTPIFRALRLIPTVEYVDLLIGSRTDSVIQNNPHIDKIFKVDKDHFRRLTRMQAFRETIQLGRQLRERKYDLLLDYSLRGEYGFFSQFFLSIPKRAGFSYKKRGFFHNIKMPLPEGFKDRHVADYACDLAEAAGIRVEDRFLEFYPSAHDIESADKIFKTRFKKPPSKFLVTSPGGGESWGKDAHFKRWPPASFAAFINRLHEKDAFDAAVVVGSAQEKELAEEMARGISIPCINLAGEVSLETTAALIGKSALFVGNDGGLVHLASALHKPVIAFYGPVDPKVYGPYPSRPDSIAIYKENLECRPCYQRFRYKSDCAKRECLQELTPEEAMRFYSNLSILERS